MKNFRPIFLKLYWVSHAQFGVDILKLFHSFRRLPRFFKDYRQFRKGYDGLIEVLPCLHDRYDESGETKDEYFWQDLIVARMICSKKPEKHVDIGSRIDGFVAHIASFREIEIFDVRPLHARIPGVVARQIDLTMENQKLVNYCDSISCLHALEHFGLGRYGDRIDPRGFEQGFTNISAMLKENGLLYLSVPIGIDRVVFNANRVCDPSMVLNLAMKNLLQLSKFTVIESGGRVIKEIIPEDSYFQSLSRQPYALGIFVFRKVNR